MQRLLISLTFVATLLISPAFAFADAPGSANGSSCDFNSRGAGSGMMYNGTCVATADYASQSNGTPGTVNLQWAQYYRDVVVNVVNNILVPILMAIAFIVFIYGAYKYFIYNAANESEKAEGRKFVMWGIIGFVVILSVWGLVNIVKETLIPSSATQTRPPYPTL